MSFGWLIAFTIIPLYAFRLVDELRQTINKLHKNLDVTVYQAEHDPLTLLPNRIKGYKVFSARLGGDEFVLIVPYKTTSELTLLAESLLLSIAEECPHSDVEVSASIGIALYPDDANNLFELKERSDAAMYLAKKKGKNTFSFYS